MPVAYGAPPGRRELFKHLLRAVSMKKHLLLVLVLCASLGRASAQVAPNAGADDYNSIFKAVKWRSIGPFRGGRSVAGCGVVGDPRTYYMGKTGGGPLKTGGMGI